MLIYSRILDEVAPEAFTLPQAEPTVADLLAVVGGSRNAQGRRLELVSAAVEGGASYDGVNPATPLRDLGIGNTDLVTVRAVGSPVPDRAPSVAPVVDVASLQMPADSKRLSEYEELTRWTQWEAPFHIDGATPNLKIWSDDSTVLQSSDWNAYRTPDKLYYRTYVTKQSRAGRSVETAFDFAYKDDQLAQVDPARIARLRDVVGVLQYPDWGLCVVHQQTTRFALSSWIAGSTCFVMFDDLRPAWMEQERFQPTRRIVEELLATLDWGKAIVLADVIFEPLNTRAAHALLNAGSLTAGDGLTPFVTRSIEEDKQRHRESAAEFLRMVGNDEQYGALNRELIATWVADLLPRAHEAAVALAGGDVDLSEPLSWIREQFASIGIDVAAPAGTVEELTV